MAGSNSRVKAQTKQLNANCAGTWTVRFTAAGVYTFTMANVLGEVVSTQTVEVLGVVANAAPFKGGQLSRTGFDGVGLAIWGGLFVLVGAGAVLVLRRRGSAKMPA